MIRPTAIVTGILFFSVFLSAASTTTTLSVTPPSPEFGQTVTLTASVTPATALGFVSFLDEGVLVGSATLHSGTAQSTTLTLSGGRHSLVAVYGGNTGQGFSASQSAAQSYIVTAVFGSGFAPAHNYGAALFPYSVAVADFNGDGKADLAVANAHSDSVSVMLGNGDGTFQTEVPYTVGNAPQSVVAGDVDGDGIVDLVVVNTGDSTVEVLLGNGNGTFHAGGTFTVQANPLDVVIGDFNLDGKLDLAVANGPNSAGVSILLGNGDGTFHAFTASPAGTNANSLAVGDFNGDGKPDLAVTDLINNDVNVLLGNGDGTFHAATSSPFMVDSGPTSIAVGDFNGDGKPDLAVANGTSNDVSVLLGNGDGSFQTAVNYAIGSSTQPVSLATGDFNGDGILDLAVANHLANTASVLLGNSNGTFQAAAGYGASFFPQAIAVGSFTGDGRADLVVANANGNLTTNVSILLAAVPLQFYPLTPCRIADTRTGQGFTGAFGPPSLAAFTDRNFPILSSACNIPSAAKAYSLNFTVVPSGPLGFLSAWPEGDAYPGVSTLNSSDGSVIANAAIVPAGASGGITVIAGNPTDLIIDINGYFAAPGSSGLEFFPLTPCRIADTRSTQGFTGAFGPPSLAGSVTRDFPLATSPCLSGSEQAYSLNMTVVPPGPLGFLSVWPTGQPYPGVSTLNSPDGTTLANAAIVPAGTSGDVNVLAGNPTDVIIDINGKFAAPAGGLQFYAVTPCRVADTRSSQNFTGAFGPPSLAASQGRNFPIQSSPCGIPSTVQAYALNMTVVPPGPVSFLSAWPAGQAYPGVSTLNSPDGFVIANAAIVPAGTGTGSAITVLAGNQTDLIIDIVGYFAP